MFKDVEQERARERQAAQASFKQVRDNYAACLQALSQDALDIFHKAQAGSPFRAFPLFSLRQHWLQKKVRGNTALSPAQMVTTCSQENLLDIQYGANLQGFIPLGNLTLMLTPLKRTLRPKPASPSTYPASRYTPPQTPDDAIIHRESLHYGSNLQEVYLPDGEPKTFNLDDDGRVKMPCLAGQEYRIDVAPITNEDEIKSWMAGYQAILNNLVAFLDTEWNNVLAPEWQRYLEKSSHDRMLSKEAYKIKGINNVADDIVDSVMGSVSSLRAWWTGISVSLDWASEETVTAYRNAIAEKDPQQRKTLAPVFLTLQDEVYLFLHLYAAESWKKLMPPHWQSYEEGVSQGKMSKVVLCLIAELVVFNAVIGGVAGAAHLVSSSIESVRKAMQVAGITLKAGKVRDHIESMFVRLYEHMKLPQPQQAQKIMAGSSDELMIAGGDTARFEKSFQQLTVIEQQSIKTAETTEAATIGNSGKASPKVGEQPKDLDPVSMLTGEEQLELTDIDLSHLPLPFRWQRLYRTAAADINNGLGFGWSHSLSHRLTFGEKQIIWLNQENQRIAFDYPDKAAPLNVNPLGEAAIWLGENPDEFLLIPQGEAATYHFTRRGNEAQFTAISNKYGQRHRLQYDNQQRLTALLFHGGQQRLRFDYGDDATPQLITRVTFETLKGTGWQTTSATFSYHYRQQQLTEVTDSLARRERYEYDAQNVILSRKMAGGAAFYWQWEGEGCQARCVRQWSNLPNVESRYKWDDEQLAVTVMQSDGTQYIYQRDKTARLIKEVSATGAVTCHDYNEKGQKIRTLHPNGSESLWQYNEQGLLTGYCAPDGQQTSYHWWSGNLVRVTQGEKSWLYHHNALGDVVNLTDPAGQVTHYRYDANGRKTETHFPDGSVHYQRWSTQGLLLSESLSDGQLREYAYDELGRVTLLSDAQGNQTRYAYDAAGQLIALTHPDGTQQRYRYNDYGKVTQVTDEAGRVTRYEYQAPLHLVTKKILPDGSVLNYRYDNRHLQVSEIENQRGEKYRLRYDADGRLTEEIGFDGVITRYAYDAMGNLAEKQEFGTALHEAPLVTTYLRDATGRLLEKRFADESKEYYHYDSAGRLTKVTDSHGNVLVWEYDVLDRLTAEHQNWATLRHRYAPDTGVLTGTRLPDGQWIEYHHQAGQLTGMTLDGQPLAGFGYDSTGRLEARRQGNSLHNHFRYDTLGRLSEHRLFQPGTAGEPPQTRWSQRYQYQADGELATITGSQERTFSYDDNRQLTAVAWPQKRAADRHSHISENFGYDSTGNRTTQPGEAFGNRLPFFGDRHFEYDRFGNLIKEKRGKGQQLITHYRYDCRHRLIRVEKYDGTVAEYTYDAFNRRLSKTVNGKLTEFIWSGNKLIAETDNQNHWRSYLYEPGSFRPLATVIGNARERKTHTYWYQNDHLGTPHSLTDSMGKTVWTGEYNAYGELAEEWFDDESPKVGNNLRFQGQYFDSETGLHYNLNRYYDPKAGRYLTQDPVKLEGGLNAYNYVDGNPINWVDPLGLFKQDGTGFDKAAVKMGSPLLPKVSSSMDDVLATGKLPGGTGIVITDRFVSYHDLFKLSTHNESGIAKEVMLVRQDINGRMKYVIYSGETSRVGVPKGSRPVAHTHPTENIHQKWPSSDDMKTINKYYYNQLELKMNHKAQPHSIIWGKERGDTTTIYPGPHKDPLPTKRKKDRHPKRNDY